MATRTDPNLVEPPGPAPGGDFSTTADTEPALADEAVTTGKAQPTMASRFGRALATLSREP